MFDAPWLVRSLCKSLKPEFAKAEDASIGGGPGAPKRKRRFARVEVVANVRSSTLLPQGTDRWYVLLLLLLLLLMDDDAVFLAHTLCPLGARHIGAGRAPGQY